MGYLAKYIGGYKTGPCKGPTEPQHAAKVTIHAYHVQCMHAELLDWACLYPGSCLVCPGLQPCGPHAITHLQKWVSVSVSLTLFNDFTLSSWRMPCVCCHVESMNTTLSNLLHGSRNGGCCSLEFNGCTFEFTDRALGFTGQASGFNSCASGFTDRASGFNSCASGFSDGCLSSICLI